MTASCLLGQGRAIIITDNHRIAPAVITEGFFLSSFIDDLFGEAIVIQFLGELLPQSIGCAE